MKKNIIFSLGALAILPLFVACKPSTPDDSTISKNHTHEYGEVNYVYGSDMLTLTASKACTIEGCSDTVSETVNVAKIVIKDATCTEDGEVTYTSDNFTKDGFEVQTKNDTIKVLGHDLVHHDKINATCEADGSLEYDTCSRCDYTTYSDSTKLDKLGHNYQIAYTWNDEEKTCTATKVCLNDSHDILTEKVTAFEQVKRAARCDREGQSNLIATFSNEAFETQEKTIALPKTEHHLITEEGYEATCEHVGMTDYTYCDICGEVFQSLQMIDKAPHNYVRAGAKEATCTENGQTGDLECTYCHDVKEHSKTIYATGHTEVKDEYIAGDCLNPYDFYGRIHCSTCGEILSEGEKRETSVYDEQTSTFISGSESLRTETADYPSMLHKHLVYDYSVEATCTEEGHTRGIHCEDCSKVLAESTVIPALGHNIVVKSAKEPTCEKEGTEIRICSRCGLSERVTLPVVDHSYDENDICIWCHNSKQYLTREYNCCLTSGLHKSEFPTIHDYDFDNYQIVVGYAYASLDNSKVIFTFSKQNDSYINRTKTWFFEACASGAIDSTKCTNNTQLKDGEIGIVTVHLKNGETLTKTVTQNDTWTTPDDENVWKAEFDISTNDIDSIDYETNIYVNSTSTDTTIMPVGTIEGYYTLKYTNVTFYF